MSRRKGTPKWVDVLLGIGYAAIVLAVLAGSALAYNRAFVPSVDVELTTGAIGNSLQEGSDVKLSGVPVGTVTEIRTAPDGAVLTLALKPETAARLPQDTKARLLPKTLFGERYVALQAADLSGAGLSAGDTIRQDTSREATELGEVLDELLPLLRSIQPAKLQATLNELATMLRGRGAELGDTMEKWGDYLARLEPQIPQLTEDLDKLAQVARGYNDAAPDLLNALETMTTTSATLVDRAGTLTDVYARVIGAADATTAWTDANEDTLITLSKESRRALEATAPYAPQFPCLLKGFADFVPVMDRALGAGTDEPGIHVRLTVVKSRGKYLPGKDAPTFASGGSPRCPYVTGNRSGARPASAGAPRTIGPPPTTLAQAVTETTGLGQQNSPAENQMIAELMAPTNGMAPRDYPEWSSLLLGPVLRGAEVTVR